jgi:hypothetical protein
MLIDDYSVTFREETAQIYNPETEQFDTVEVRYACLTLETGEYVEIPAPLSMSVEDHLVKANDDLLIPLNSRAFDLLDKKIQTKHKSSDDVFADGSFVRPDRPIQSMSLTPQEQALVPDGAVNPWGGRYTNYRPPYDAAGISIYDQRTPPPELLSSLGLSESSFSGTLCSWYAVKKGNNPNSAKFYKFVEMYHEDYGVPPTLPPEAIPMWIARIYDENGAPTPERDIFFMCSPCYVKKWCEAQGWTYPIPANDTREPYLYGYVWDEVTREKIAVKAYINLEEPDFVDTTYDPDES